MTTLTVDVVTGVRRALVQVVAFTDLQTTLDGIAADQGADVAAIAVGCRVNTLTAGRVAVLVCTKVAVLAVLGLKGAACSRVTCVVGA